MVAKTTQQVMAAMSPMAIHPYVSLGIIIASMIAITEITAAPKMTLSLLLSIFFMVFRF